jgi:DNA invertase Pin-like site-specific DNA recombinase
MGRNLRPIRRSRSSTTLRLVLLSDTHEFHREVEVPDGDILIHAGDFTMFSKNVSAIADFNTWLGELPHRHKILIFGNHEFFAEAGISGTEVRRPALDRLLKDAPRRKFDVVLVWSCDRLARSTKHFLQVLDELNEMGIQFLSQREAIDTEGPLGRAIVVIISAIAELERSLIVERVRAGMRRARLEGRRIGRTPLDVNHAALVQDRLSGMSLTKVAKKYGLSRASVVRFVRDSKTRHSVDIPHLSIKEKDIPSGSSPR